MHRSYPKEGKKKDKQTISDLKAENRKLMKEVTFLRNEIKNMVKPVRERKTQVQPDTKEWRQDFMKRYRKEVLNKDE